METSRTGNKHQGKQVKRFRESIGMKQDVLADALKTSQQNISYYEKQETLDDEVFSKLAISMGVEPEILKDFNASSSVFNIHEMKGHAQAFEMNGQANQSNNFNPIDKIVEQASTIEGLYKSLLKSEQEKVEILTSTVKTLQELLESKKD